ncbi:MAG: hypothetical protein R2792_04470 [Saprospiraceae bacterium]|jgi:hypothetical protein
MKTILALPICFLLALNTLMATPQGQEPLVTIAENRIYLMVEEMPVKDLVVEIKNENNQLILKKVFQTDAQRWFLDIPKLESGSYRVFVGGVEAGRFNRGGKTQECLVPAVSKCTLR